MSDGQMTWLVFHFIYVNTITLQPDLLTAILLTNAHGRRAKTLNTQTQIPSFKLAHLFSEILKLKLVQIAAF